MGINGLNAFIKTKFPDIIQEKNLRELGYSKCAIDTSIFIYKFLYKNDRFIEGFFQQIYRLITNGITPIYIFDGCPPKEKLEIIKNRKSRKKELTELIEKMEKNQQENPDTTSVSEKIYLSKLKKKNINVTSYHTDLLKDFLSKLNISYVQADGEADVVCNNLLKNKKVDCIISDDMDLLASGDTKLLYKFNVLSNKVIYYDKTVILEKMGLQEEQWQKFCVLSGCDYCSRIPGLGNVNAFKIVKDLSGEDFWEKLKIKCGEEQFDTYKQKFSKAIDIFNESYDTSTIEVATPLIKEKEVTLNFLKKFTNLTEKQIKNRLSVIDSNYRKEQ